MALRIPSILIGPLRSALDAQGLDEAIVRDDGTVDPGPLIAQAYDSVEFRSRLTPSVLIETRDLFRGGEPSWVARALAPSATISGPSGRIEIAPFGVPDRNTGVWVLGLVGAGLMGLGYLIGRSKR